MRTARLWCVAVALVVFQSVAGARPDPRKAEPVPTGGWILRTDTPVKIDGVLDDPCWKKARPVRVDFLNGKRGVLSDEPRMTAWYAYDDYYLYIAYETFDKNLQTQSGDHKEGPLDNQRMGCEIWNDAGTIDVVEFFISFGDERFMWEIHHNASNEFNDVFCIVPDPEWQFSQSSNVRYGIFFGMENYIHDDIDGVHKLAIAVKLKPKADGKPSTVNDPKDLDAGYTGEIRLPWFGIGAPANRRKWVPGKPLKPGGRPVMLPDIWQMSGQTILLLAVCQNSDLKERYYHSSPTRHGNWFHTTAAHWPKYALVTEEQKPAPKPKK